MKAYRITSPEQLREIIPLVKDDKAAKSAANLATVWSVATRQNKPDAFVAYIKLGRSATLCREREGREIVLGDLRLKEAREIAKTMAEYTGGNAHENR